MFAWKKKKAAESEAPAAEVPGETFRIPRGALISKKKQKVSWTLMAPAIVGGLCLLAFAVVLVVFLVRPMM